MQLGVPPVLTSFSKSWIEIEVREEEYSFSRPGRPGHPTRLVAYLVGSGSDSNKCLESALELAMPALMRAEEDLEREGN